MYESGSWNVRQVEIRGPLLRLNSDPSARMSLTCFRNQIGLPIRLVWFAEIVGPKDLLFSYTFQERYDATISVCCYRLMFEEESNDGEKMRMRSKRDLFSLSFWRGNRSLLMAEMMCEETTQVFTNWRIICSLQERRQVENRKIQIWGMKMQFFVLRCRLEYLFCCSVPAAVVAVVSAGGWWSGERVSHFLFSFLPLLSWSTLFLAKAIRVRAETE